MSKATRILLIAAAWTFAAPAAQATLVTGPWNVATTNPVGGQGDGPIHNANTASPIVGDLVNNTSTSSNAADGEMFDSAFPAITLAFPGDKITFTGSVTLNGTINSPATSGNPRAQFRFGLFDGDEAGLDDNGWVGYLVTNRHGNAGTPGGSLTRKSVGNTNIYLSTTGTGNISAALASLQGDGTAASLFNDGTYAMSLSIERNASGHLIINSSLTSSSGYTLPFSFTDTTAATTATYTFDHLGFLLGGNLDTDQAVFSNLDVAFFSTVPESTLGGMAAIGAIIGGAWRSCRKKRAPMASDAA